MTYLNSSILSAQQHRIVHAATAMACGGVVAYPTEAVWGLGCDPFNARAVGEILRLKKRPADKGVILIAACIEQVEPFLTEITADQRPLLERTWPGPTTFLVPDNGVAPKWITGKFDTLAIRVSDHPTVQALCNAYGGAIVSTSANPASFPEARNRLKVRSYFGDQLADICIGEIGKEAKPSAIIDLASGKKLR